MFRFPISLIRRDANIDPHLEGVYEKTERGRPMTQVFQAQTSYLSEIAFDSGFLMENREMDHSGKLQCIRRIYR